MKQRKQKSIVRVDVWESNDEDSSLTRFSDEYEDNRHLEVGYLLSVAGVNLPLSERELDNVQIMVDQAIKARKPPALAYVRNATVQEVMAARIRRGKATKAKKTTGGRNARQAVGE